MYLTTVFIFLSFIFMKYIILTLLVGFTVLPQIVSSTHTQYTLKNYIVAKKWLSRADNWDQYIAKIDSMILALDRQQQDLVLNKINSVVKNKSFISKRDRLIMTYISQKTLREKEENTDQETTFVNEAVKPKETNAITYSVEVIDITKVRWNNILGKIQTGDIVDIHYTATNSNGRVIATTRNNDQAVTIMVWGFVNESELSHEIRTLQKNRRTFTLSESNTDIHLWLSQGLDKLRQWDTATFTVKSQGITQQTDKEFTLNNDWKNIDTQEAITYSVEIVEIIKVRWNKILGKIQTGDIVELHYTATNSNGRVIASTRDNNQPVIIMVWGFVDESELSYEIKTLQKNRKAFILSESNTDIHLWLSQGLDKLQQWDTATFMVKLRDIKSISP